MSPRVSCPLPDHLPGCARAHAGNLRLTCPKGHDHHPERSPMRIYRLTIAVTSAVAMVTAACNQDDVSPGIPLVSDVSVTLNPNNSLSMMVSARVVNADSVRASYLSANEAQRFTPYYPVHGETVTLAVLGLLPNTTYALALQAYGGGATVLSNPSSASTGDLPDALKSV